MKICIIGTGYVGLTSGVCFASKGHIVKCVDIDESKVKMINNGDSPIYEAGLKDLLKQALSNGLLKATLNADDAVKESDVVFLCLGTPSREDGSINLDFIKKGALIVSENLNKYKVVVVKSTVVPGTSVNVVLPILEKSGEEFGLCMNPEFLKEGSAVKDFLEGDRIVLGVSSERVESVMRELYKDFPQEVFVTNPTTAEMIKYANNSLLATKISFANELGNICKKLKIDAYDVMDGVGLDKRLNRSFLNAGAGFGGSCFPKDVKAIVSKGLELDEPMILLKSVLEVNKNQPFKMIKLLKTHSKIKGKNIAVLGLAFKPGTDDIREAPSITIIDELLKLGAEVISYDPQAIKNAKKYYKDRIEYANSAKECVKEADVVLIVTDWDEFKQPDLYKGKIVIDGRRIKTNSKEYEGICW